MDNSQFSGFDLPDQNWSKLPHQFIYLLPELTSSEVVCLLYLLRHTWGYHEYGQQKRISIDEFCNGRKRKSAPRMDRGTGLSANTVRTALQGLEEKEIITVSTDKRDKARIKKYYGIHIRGSNFEPLESNFEPLGAKIEDRTKKETLERNSSIVGENTADLVSVDKPDKPEVTYHDVGDEFGDNGNKPKYYKWQYPKTEFEKRVMAAQNIPNKKYWSKDDKPSLTKLRTLEKSMRPLRELPSQDYPVEWVDHVLEWYADKCKNKLLPLQAFVTSVNKPEWKARWLEEQGAELTGVSVVKEVAGSWM